MRPVPPRRPQIRQDRRRRGHLPGGRFGCLIGHFYRATLVPEGHARPDDNHLYLWLRVPEGPFAGHYECAISVRSNDHSGILFTDLEEELNGDSLPEPGFLREPFSYAGLALTDRDFRHAWEGALQSLILHYAETSARVAVFGETYDRGTGMHDVHMNSGEPHGSPHADRENQDGALAFYFDSRAQGSPYPYVRWLLLKFAAQSLSEG